MVTKREYVRSFLIEALFSTAAVSLDEDFEELAASVQAARCHHVEQR